MKKPVLTQRRATAVISLFVFLLIFALSCLTPLAADDYNYFYSTADTKPISSFAEVVRSMQAHRIALNGRVFAHGFVQILLMFDKLVFNAVNALLAAALVWILSAYLEGGRGCTFALLAALAALWCFLPVFGEAALWLTGACNYGWGLVLAALFMLPAYKFFVSGKLELPLAVKGIMLIAVFGVGAWSENASFAMLGMMFCLLALSLLRWKKLPVLPALMFAVGCGGYLFMALSPAVLTWKAKTEISDIWSNICVLAGKFAQKLGVPLPAFAVLCCCCALAAALLLIGLFQTRRAALRRVSAILLCVSSLLLCAAIAGVVWINGGFLKVLSSAVFGVAASIALFVILFCAALLRKTDIWTLLCAGAFFLCGLASAAILVLAAYIPARVLCATVTFCALGSMLLVRELITAGSKTARAAVCALCALALVYGAVGVPDVASTYRQNEARLEIIVNAPIPEGGIYPVAYVDTIKCVSKYSAFYSLDDVKPDGSWPTDIMGWHYGVLLFGTGN